VDNQLIVALDVADLKTAKRLVDQLSGAASIFKVGSQLFTAYGPRIIDVVHKKKCKVFLDLKYHDIPNTVKKAVEQARSLGVFMLTLHTLGGAEMLKVAASVPRRPLLLGVTVLTSMNTKDLFNLGIKKKVEAEVLHLAKLAQRSGLDGVVCSPKEITLLRKNLKKNFVIVTPGIRPIKDKLSDQKRVMSPKEAIREGSSYIVVGRPILEATSPLRAAENIIKEMKNVKS